MPTIEVRFSKGLHLGRLLSNIRPTFMTGTNILAYPKGRPNVCFQKYHERLKKLVRDKHSSLLGRRVSDEEKKFYTVASCSSVPATVNAGRPPSDICLNVSILIFSSICSFSFVHYSIAPIETARY